MKAITGWACVGPFLVRAGSSLRRPSINCPNRLDGELARDDGELARLDGELARDDGELAREDGEFAREDGEFARDDGELARTGRVTCCSLIAS